MYDFYHAEWKICIFIPLLLLVCIIKAKMNNCTLTFTRVFSWDMGYFHTFNPIENILRYNFINYIVTPFVIILSSPTLSQDVNNLGLAWLCRHSNSWLELWDGRIKQAVMSGNERKMSALSIISCSRNDWSVPTLIMVKRTMDIIPHASLFLS